MQLVIISLYLWLNSLFRWIIWASLKVISTTKIPLYDIIIMCEKAKLEYIFFNHCEN